MATEKQTTDGGTGGKIKTPANKPTAEGGDDESDMFKSTDEVPVSESYQKATHALLNKANKHHVMHVRNALNTQEDKLRREEKPDTLSDSEMPSMD